MKNFILLIQLLLITTILPAYGENLLKTRIIINPNAGTSEKGKIEKTLTQQLDKTKFDFEIIYTKGPNHATALGKEAAALGYDLVIGVGGDGTINEIGKGLIGSQTAMGIIPSGSGNGLARHLKIPEEPEKAVKVINRFHRKPIDTVQINDNYFLGTAGIGIDAKIAKEFAKSKRRAFLSYAAIALKNYSNYSSQVFELIVDGKKIQRDGLLVSFAKSSQFGNDYKIAHHAKLDDGHFHLIILKKPPFYSLPKILFKLKNGTIYNSKYYESICCKEIQVKNKKMIGHIDGEPAYFENGLHLKVLPKSLIVIDGYERK